MWIASAGNVQSMNGRLKRSRKIYGKGEHAIRYG
jgi:hypothetical protein